MTKKAILCVDDERIVLMALKDELKRELAGEYFVETAPTAAEALTLLSELKEEGLEEIVVISDYFIPDLRGDAFLKKAKALVPDARLFMLTGDDGLSKANMDLDGVGLEGIIKKPWSSWGLVSAIKGGDGGPLIVEGDPALT